MLLPHHDGWDLNPSNGHENSKILLKEDYYWDSIDDDSPFGNDNGADALSYYSEFIERDSRSTPLGIYKSLLKNWDMNISDYYATDEYFINQTILENEFSLSCADDAAISIAFGMFIIKGYININFKPVALAAIERESTNTILNHRGWVNKKERSHRLTNFSEKINLMPTEPNKRINVEASIRKKGLFKLIVGSLAGIASGFLLHYMDTSGSHINMFYLAAIAAPAAWGLGGLLEFIMNRPFSEMEIWWNSLKGWQRGVLGLFVVILSFALMISAVAIAGYFQVI